MTLAVPMLVGAGIGLGVLLIALGLRRRSVPLAALVAALDQAGVAVAAPATEERATSSPLGRMGVRLLESLTFVDLGVLRHDLRVLDRTLEEHAVRKILASLAGFLFPLLVFASIALLGINPPSLLALATCIGLGAGGFIYPDLPLRDEAEARRRTFRRSLSAFLDLTTIFIAGGTHETQAMTLAAEAGEGWAFAKIRDALHAARNTGRDLWVTLDELGVELGVDELCELAGSIRLSGSEGSVVKETLAAAADSMRFTQLMAVEAASEAQTQKMVLPLGVVALGFILFIGYGVVAAMDTGTTPQLLEPATPVTVAR
jgi:tight adherence protein C